MLITVTYKIIFAPFLAMRKKQIIVWPTGYQKENWGWRGIYLFLKAVSLFVFFFFTQAYKL